ncbi:MAG: hypothetical protein GY744_01135 [Gammaproteobacteria bacterium]|nr:hypothetical protein [Gammaproteobacteria bacterium]
MSNTINKIFILISVMILVSCSESLDIQLEPEVTLFLSTDSKQTIRLTTKDKEYTALNQWLREHNSDWYPTSGNFPGGVYIKTGDYGIQITERHVILYSTKYSNPRAINIQKIAKSDLSEIKTIGQ